MPHGEKVAQEAAIVPDHLIAHVEGRSLAVSGRVHDHSCLQCDVVRVELSASNGDQLRSIFAVVVQVNLRGARVNFFSMNVRFSLSYLFPA